MTICKMTKYELFVDYCAHLSARINSERRLLTCLLKQKKERQLLAMMEGRSSLYCLVTRYSLANLVFIV